MIEQELEKKIVDYFELQLNGYNIQVVGLLQSSANDLLKMSEDADAEGILIVKAHPRSYETFTSVYATISFDIVLTMRAECDVQGNGYLEVSDNIMKKLHKMQKMFLEYSAMFTVENKYTPVGFKLDGGDFGLDQDKCIWQFQQTITLDGIIEEQ